MNRSTTVRELGGAIGAELSERMSDDLHPGGSIDVEFLRWTVETTMGVIARYVGAEITNDLDFPVDPLPRRFYERMEDSEVGS